MAAKLSILVADPHRDGTDSLVELFRLEGHAADAAYSGEEAVDAWRSRRYDIAFLDADSYRAVRDVDADARLYMMTGHSIEQLVRNAAHHAEVGLLQNPAGAHEVVQAVDALKGGGIVLVAEDDPDLGPQLRQLIEGSGRRCELVCNGREALARVAAGGVDVLVLDLNMPLVNGIEVCAELRRQSASVPTVLITAYCDALGDQIDALGGIERTRILHKPFDPSLLLARLDRLAG